MMKVIYTTDKLLKKIRNIMESHSFYFTNGIEATPKQLCHFLYKINFLTARKELEGGEVSRKYFEENKYLASESADFGFDWEIHPAYRWGLQPDDILSIFQQVALSSDE